MYEIAKFLAFPKQLRKKSRRTSEERAKELMNKDVEWNKENKNDPNYNNVFINQIVEKLCSKGRKIYVSLRPQELMKYDSNMDFKMKIENA